jgi:hypothetical protein
MWRRFEHDDPTRRDESGGAGFRIAARASVFGADAKSAEAAKTYVFSAGQGGQHFLERAIEQGFCGRTGEAGDAGVNGVRDVITRHRAPGNSCVQNPIRLSAVPSKNTPSAAGKSNHNAAENVYRAGNKETSATPAG